MDLSDRTHGRARLIGATDLQKSLGIVNDLLSALIPTFKYPTAMSPSPAHRQLFSSSNTVFAPRPGFLRI